MHFQRVGAQIVLPGVEILLQEFTVDRLAGAHDKTRQNGELFRRNLHRLLLQIDLLAGEVQLQIIHLHQIVAVALVAPQEGAHACLQFDQREGFDQVVVGAGVQPVDAIFQGVAGGQDQHRQIDLLAAPLPQQRGAVHVRQAEIQDHHAVLAGDEQAVGLRRRGGAVADVAFAGQRQRQPLLQQFIILNDQQLHDDPQLFW